MRDNNSLAYKTWDYKYHIVFPPRYIRQAIYEKYKVSWGNVEHVSFEVLRM